MFESEYGQENLLNFYHLFLAKVIKVYYNSKTTQSENGIKYVERAATVDGLSISGRGVIRNIRMITPTASNTGVPAGEIRYPSVGDIIVCGYIEGKYMFPVCFGSIVNPQSKPVTSVYGGVQQDMLMHHPSNSFIRMRNKSNTDKKIDTENNLSEMRIQHRSGCSIVIEDYKDGDNTNTTLTITGPKGTTISIDSTGKINILSQERYFLKAKDIIFQNFLDENGEKARQTTEENKDEVLTNTQIPYDTFTGRVIRGVPFILAGPNKPPES